MPAAKKDLLITLDDAFVDKAATVVASLKRAGLSDVKHLETIGIVSGKATAAKLEALKKVQGVRAVEESTWTQLPPPDAPVQ